MKSVRTALRLFIGFERQQQHFSVGELSEQTGLSKSHVSKVLAAFVESGLLVQNPDTREFSVGARAFVLGVRFANYDPLSQAGLPVLRELKERTGHSTRLHVTVGDSVLYLLGVEGPHLRDTGWRAGAWMPYLSVPGQITLAFMDPERAEALLSRQYRDGSGRKSVIEHKRLRQMIAKVRAQGFGLQRGEITSGLGSIGVPVLGRGQDAIGVISVVFPIHLVSQHAEAGLVEQLHQAARQLSLRMGCPVYPFGGRVTPPPAPAPARGVAGSHMT